MQLSVGVWTQRSEDVRDAGCCSVTPRHNTQTWSRDIAADNEIEKVHNSAVSLKHFDWQSLIKIIKVVLKDW